MKTEKRKLTKAQKQASEYKRVRALVVRAGWLMDEVSRLRLEIKKIAKGGDREKELSTLRRLEIRADLVEAELEDVIKKIALANQNGLLEW
ncbi:MAG: hypothetical protein ACTTH5_00100 [Wolinella sp.]